ncbi:hypothetical protein ARMGADRAFT_1035966 [Armillaria gallica]|uniref:Uncharacterized protein n=1 Tax=Armillaria gallica TaxID=47427 RepID=A0A2H3CSG8_ARMGA|nr:hypothetical protein ARMGADRAFT_1035966 [Armillaria gallica]
MGQMPGVPVRMVATWLNKLAKEKSGNTVFIVPLCRLQDSCYSAGITRADDGGQGDDDDWLVPGISCMVIAAKCNINMEFASRNAFGFGGVVLANCVRTAEQLAILIQPPEYLARVRKRWQRVTGTRRRRTGGYTATSKSVGRQCPTPRPVQTVTDCRTPTPPFFLAFTVVLHEKSDQHESVVTLFYAMRCSGSADDSPPPFTPDTFSMTSHGSSANISSAFDH